MRRFFVTPRRSGLTSRRARLLESCGKFQKRDGAMAYPEASHPGEKPALRAGTSLATVA